VQSTHKAGRYLSPRWNNETLAETIAESLFRGIVAKSTAPIDASMLKKWRKVIGDFGKQILQRDFNTRGGKLRCRSLQSLLRLRQEIRSWYM